MSIILPDWVAHYADDKKVKRATIFSVSVHPDGSRLATAGLDSKIRIWATLPILSADIYAQPDSHKLLSTLDRHTGSVLVVRWSNSGRFLASGSDDTIALIWDLDSSGTGLGGSFGSTEVNVESWRPHRRLVGHESDVADIAWSADDEYVATVGLDSLAFIWSGTTFERLRKIDGHQGFVKGVVFDPLGQYLATASDDKTVKIWRTDDWGLAADISAPFITSPSSTFFRRPSWSPDGNLLSCANAMSGPVFVSSVVKRVEWNSDISFVGHENSVIVTAFSPRIFSGFDGGSHACVVALGSMDQSVSIWVTGLDHPVLVARDLFERQVVDLSWSSDGYTLYASSSDGTVAVITLTAEYLSEALSDERLQSSRAKHGYKRVRTAMPSHVSVHAVGTLDRPNVLQVRKAGSMRPAQTSASPAMVRPAPGRTERLKQEITITRDGKRRIKPTQLSSDGFATDAHEPIHRLADGGGSANAVNGTSALASGSAAAAMGMADTPMDISVDLGRRPSSGSRMMMARGSPALAIEDTMAKMMSMFTQTQQQQMQQFQQFQQLMQAQVQAHAQTQAQQPQLLSQPQRSSTSSEGQDEAAGPTSASETRGEKRKASFGDEDIEPLSKIPRGRTKAEIGKTLGGETPRESAGRPVAVRRRIEGSVGIVEEGVHRGVRLAIPELLSVYRRREEPGIIEIRNFDASRPSEIALLDDGDSEAVVWLDFSPSPGLLATATASFSAVALEDNSILLYSAKGRRLGNLYLDAPCFRLESSGNVLMAITVGGFMHRWDIRADREIHRPVSVLHLLGDPDNLLSASIHANGAPIVLLRTEKAYTFDDRKLGWVCVGDGWYADHSSAWDGKTRGRGTDNATVRDPVKAIEAEINNLVVARSQRPSPVPIPAAAAATATPPAAANSGEADAGGDGGKEGGGSSDDGEREAPRLAKMRVPSERQADFELAVTLRHLETRLLAATIFASASEYKNYLMVYARRLAEEGIRNQSEDLIKSLIGPIYHKPGLEEEWDRTILGHDKRQLLGTVLQILAKPRLLTGLVQPYQDILAQMKA